MGLFVQTYGRKLKSYGDFECPVELWNEHVLKMVDQFRFLRSIGYIDFLLIPAFFGLSGQYTILYYVYFVFPFYWGCGEWMDVASSRSLHSRFLNCLSILFFSIHFYSFLPVFSIDISLLVEIFSPPEEEVFIWGTWIQLGCILLNYREWKFCLLTLFLVKWIFCMCYNRDDLNIFSFQIARWPTHWKGRGVG